MNVLHLLDFLPGKGCSHSMIHYTITGTADYPAVPVNCLIRPACCGGIFNIYIGNYFPGLKESFRLTERLNTRWPGAQSLLSGQK